MKDASYQKLKSKLFAFVTIATICSSRFSLGAAPESPIVRQQDLAETVFGEKSGKPVENGFLFKDGAYVEAPYVVSRRGVDIYVNEVKVDTPVRWPPVDYDDKKPEMPSGLTEKSTFRDLEVPDTPGESWDRIMVRWLKRHNEKDKAMELIVAFYRSLPFVKDVESRGDLLIITTKDGGKVEGDIGGSVYRPATKEESLAELERVRARFEDRLAKGDCFFLYSKGGEL